MEKELPEGSKRVDGHPTGNNLTLADRVLLLRFASPMRADGSKTDRRNVAVQSFSDGRNSSSDKTREQADGSEKTANVDLKRGAGVELSFGTDTQQHFWTASLLFPHALQCQSQIHTIAPSRNTQCWGRVLSKRAAQSVRRIPRGGVYWQGQYSQS